MQSSLLRARQLLADGDRTTTTAFEALLARVHPLLDQRPPAVVHKTRLPASGDTHDYISIGPYWWPNPATADGLPYVRRDGEVNPERRNNATDYAANEQMTRGVTEMLLAFALGGDDRFGAAAGAWLRTWFLAPQTRMNPHLRFAQAIPGITDGRGIGIIDTSGYPMLLRILRAARPRLEQAGHWTSEDDAALQAWLGTFLDWLLSSPLGLAERMEHNNHGTWFDAQAAWYALYCNRPTIARELAADALQRRISRHIAPDGSQPHELARTRPIAYTCFNLSGLMTLADAGAEVGIDLWRAATADGRSIRSACEWLMTAPIVPQPGQLDPPDERARELYTILRRAAAAYAPDGRRFAEAAARLADGACAALPVNLVNPG